MSGLRDHACSWVLLLFALACAAPPEFDTEGWLELRHPSFTLRGNLEEQEMRALGEDLALFDAVVRKVTTTRIDRARVPIWLYVLGDPAQGRYFIPQRAGGVIYPRLDGYFSIVHGSSLASLTLLHEYVHYASRGDRRIALPRWYDEGLCEFLSNLRITGDVIILGRADTRSLAVLGRQGLLPLADLFAPGDPGTVRDARFYATAWALSHYANTSDALRPRLVAFANRLVRGQEWPRAFRASFARSVDELEAELADHVAFLQSGGRRDFALDRRKLRVVHAFETERIPPADAAYHLASLYRAITPDEREPGRIRVIRQLYERALRFHPEHRRARAGLAWALAAEGDFARSEEALERATGEEDADPVLALEAARIAALRSASSAGDPDLARTLFARAIELEPRSPVTHARLARHLARIGERGAAIAAYERARELGAWSPPLDVALAREYAEGGSRSRARELLWPVAGDPHGGPTAEEARRLLREVEGRRSVD